MFDRDLIPFLYGLNSTIMWISLTVGILLFIIGYFAGGRLTLGRILMCTAVVTLISVLSLPAPMALFRVLKHEYNVETYIDKRPANIPSNDQPSNESSSSTTNNQAEAAAQGENKTGASQSRIPIPFQVLTLVMHIVWTAFLVAMGIFFYETLIVTAQEAEKR